MMKGLDRWRTSTFSGEETNCVEVANTLGEVRDSKNRTGPTLSVDLLPMVGALKEDRLNR